MSAWVYRLSEPGLWTVGHYRPDGTFDPESDHDSQHEAARRIRWLNGGDMFVPPDDREVDVMDHRIVDHIAAYLGTRADWNGADALEVIANLIATVRPHPGVNADGRDYALKFALNQGREMPTRYADNTDWEDE